MRIRCAPVSATAPQPRVGASCGAPDRCRTRAARACRTSRSSRSRGRAPSSTTAVRTRPGRRRRRRTCGSRPRPLRACRTACRRPRSPRRCSSRRRVGQQRPAIRGCRPGAGTCRGNGSSRLRWYPMPRSAPRSRARWPSSRHSSCVVTMMLSFTKSPTGSALLDLVLVELDERLDRLGSADREAQHAEAHARGLLERRRVAGRDPHRRVRRGVRLRQHVARRHREELAVEARVLLGAPHLAELADDLVEHVAW